MFSLRALQSPHDHAALYALDTSFTTNRIYRVVATGLAFALEETPIVPALYKDYNLAKHVESLSALDYVVVAQADTALAGIAALELQQWNRRAVLWHLYVDSRYRGRGLGRKLIDNIVQAAHERQARCLWLETQNVNYPAIQFYQQMGFQCCGLDMALYDPVSSRAADETAIFFTRRLTR